MPANQQLTFLQERIKEIGSAIFFNLSDSVLKLPTSIVNSLTVDDYGFVWFYIQRPRQDLREFEKEFPVRLDFFRKGANYFLQVMGKAWIVSDPEEINILEETLPAEKKTNENMVLVKVKIQRAEYHDTSITTRTTNSSWWQNAVSSLYTWLRSSNGAYRQEEVFYNTSLN